MLVRVKTAIIYGLIIFLILIPGFTNPEFTVLLLVLIAVFSAKEMSLAFDKIQINFKPGYLRLTYLSFLPAFIFLFLNRSKLVTAEMLWNNRTNQSLNLTLNKDLLLGSVFIYSLTLGLVLSYILFKPILTKGSKILKETIFQIAMGTYIAIPLFAGLLLLYLIPAGWFWFVLAIITPWIADSCAYFMGRKWGKKPIVPNLSPNKTYVGFYGSVAGTIVFYLPVFYFAANYLYLIEIKPIHWLAVTLFAGVLGALIELGDWLASAIKRYCGIKDFSNLLPGHGGVIDRFDSTFFSFTAILTIALLIHFS
ncbi:MAG: phosphatidate cytidylyltransferase [Clostridiaceae bacterium]|nr:phosphatidate cytidylyltransferase [Clostridiaceae bacterium]